jgi:hypothetical protein
MSCPDELDGAMYVDGELPGAERAAFEAHLAACPACRQRVAVLRAENALLVEALRTPEPAFAARGLVWFGLAFLAAVAGAHLGLGALAELNARLGWLSPISESAQIGLLFRLTSFLTREEVPMFFAILAMVVAALLGGTVFGLVKRSRLTSAVAALVLLLCVPAPGSATEFRHPAPGQGDVLVIPAEETIDDTLVATGRDVVVEGTVTGNLIAFAQQVRVPGEVRGSLVAFAKDVAIDGKVGGDVYSGAQNLDVRGNVLGNVHGGAGDVEIAAGARVERDVLLACEGARIAGVVGGGLHATGDVFTISGEIGRGVTVIGHELEFTEKARVGGKISATLQSRDLLRRAPGAQLASEPQIQIETRGKGHGAGLGRWLKLGFYVGQLVRLAAAFALGLVLYWLLPALFEWATPPEHRLLRAAGIGFLALVATPVAAVLLGITVIGLPIGLLALGTWIVALYISGILVALMVGQLLLRSPRKNAGAFALALLIGLALIRIGVNLPYVGGIVWFLVIVVGLGMLVAQLRRIASRLRAPAVA